MPDNSLLSTSLKRGAAARITSFALHKPLETCLLMRMGVWVGALSLLMKFLPLPRVLSLIATPARKQAQSHQNVSAERLAQLLDLLLGMDILCFTPTCWKRAPVLHRYLALGGTETRIIFGIRKEREKLLAGHAWLEADGQPILENSIPEYTVTYSFPS